VDLGYENVITATREQLDLSDPMAVNYSFRANRPDVVFLAAGTEGRILANSANPANFIYDTMMIHATVIDEAWKHEVEKLLYLGSRCIYTRDCAPPITEQMLLTGPLEPANEAYAIAKIAGTKLCQSHNERYGADFISAMPINLYGPNNNFDLQNSHVLPALIPKCHNAKQSAVTTVPYLVDRLGYARFLHVDDLADACVHLMNHYSDSQHINVGTGEDAAVNGLAEVERDLVYPQAALE
jgi:GDP-L-fucose synthase